jgi:hypothetical protein
MKSYQFFQEGHIKSYEIAHGYGNVWVKSKVMASMKHELYRVIIVCKDNGDISYCACECPACMFHLRTMIQHFYHARKLL